MRYGSSYTEIRTLPIDLEQSAMPHLAQAGHRLGPAEGLLDAFADALRDRIAGMTGVGRSSIAERRPLVFCATCGMTVLSRSAVTKSALS